MPDDSRMVLRRRARRRAMQALADAHRAEFGRLYKAALQEVTAEDRASRDPIEADVFGGDAPT